MFTLKQEEEVNTSLHRQGASLVSQSVTTAVFLLYFEQAVDIYGIQSSIKLLNPLD